MASPARCRLGSLANAIDQTGDCPRACFWTSTEPLSDEAARLLAGSSRYAYGRFLALDALGELVWIALYGGLGYAFADQWETVSDLAGNLAGALIGLLALVAGGALAYRSRRQRGLAARVAEPGAG